jgi:hypothetical protein
MSTTLEELRRLTLEQQRAESASAEPSSQPAPPLPSGKSSADTGRQPAESGASPLGIADPSSPHDDAQVRICGNAHLRKQASKQALAQASKQVSKQPRENNRFLERVREGIARKTLHPGGIKASVDLSPELSLRVKRYCLEHGNVPVRLVFIELLTAFLEEEGY